MTTTGLIRIGSREERTAKRSWLLLQTSFWWKLVCFSTGRLRAALRKVGGGTTPRIGCLDVHPPCYLARFKAASGARSVSSAIWNR